MPEALTTTQSRSRPQRLTLNSDGRRHPLLNAATAFTFVAGAAAFPLGLIVRDHLAATVIGLAAFAVGLVAQLVSATREERIFIVAGLVAAFVGMGLGIAHGGFG
jgi:ABC-type Co2+ transport system permease subunit